MTRLIDADVLKKRIDEVFANDELEFKDLIDNAPTVDTDLSKYSDKLWKEAYERGHKEGYKQAILDGKTNFSRPQGEWIIVKDERYGDNVKCPFCGKELAGTDLNFCCKCGAELIGSEKMNMEADNEMSI